MIEGEEREREEKQKRYGLRVKEIEVRKIDVIELRGPRLCNSYFLE